MILSVDYNSGIFYSTVGLTLYGLSYFGQKYYKWKTSPMNKVPGPPTPSFLLGYMLSILKEPFMNPHKRWWKDLREKHGNSLPFIAYSHLLGKWSLIILDPDIVKTVLMESYSKDSSRFEKRYFFLAQVFGEGLATLEGSAWSRHRRIIHPAFQANSLKEMLNESVPARTQALIEAWRANQGCVIDVKTHMSTLTLDVIGDVAFSHDFGGSQVFAKWADKGKELREQSKIEEAHSLPLPQTADPLMTSFNDSFKMTAPTVIMTALNLSRLERHVNRKAANTRQLLNKSVDAVIANARKKTSSSSSSSDVKAKSLLEILFDAKDSESPQGRSTLSDIELRDEVKTFIIAGHETTSTWCYWAMYALAKFPDIQAKLYSEVAKYAPTTDTSVPLLLEDVGEMEYLSAFMNELLRLYSPAGMLIRFNARQECWHGYTIPASTRLLIPLHLLHRHPGHWTNPDEFRPERWLDKESVAARHKFVFAPFSAGGRNCVGQRFAEIEGRLIVANIVRAFVIKLDESMRDKEITFTNFVTMTSKPSVAINVKER